MWVHKNIHIINIKNIFSVIYLYFYVYFKYIFNRFIFKNQSVFSKFLLMGSHFQKFSVCFKIFIQLSLANFIQDGIFSVNFTFLLFIYSLFLYNQLNIRWKNAFILKKICLWEKNILQFIELFRSHSISSVKF